MADFIFSAIIARRHSSNNRRVFKAVGEKSLVALLAATLFITASFLTVNTVANEGEPFVSDPTANKYALILVGASYADEDKKQFETWSKNLRKSLIKDFGYKTANVYLMLGDEPNKKNGSHGRANTTEIKMMFEMLSKKIKMNDQLLLVLFGHGSGVGETSKYHIVGPDLTGLEFSKFLDDLKTHNILVVNTTSASHDFTKALTGAGRVLLSATRSNAEKYDTVFPQFFVESLQKKNADKDKNGRVSALESFEYTNNQIKHYYKQRDILPSEHATLEDNSDGVFSVDPNSQNDGRVAEIAYFDVDALSQKTLTPKVAALKSKMDNIERDIFLLRGTKKALASDEYWQKIEPLLIELAKTTRDFHAAQ